MKTHTTTTLRILVCDELDPKAAPMGTEMVTEWISRLPKIKKELYNLMDLLVFSPVPNRLVKRHFRQIQSESIYLINILDGYIQLSPDANELKLEVLNCLREILAHINKRYGQFFNPDLLIPSSDYQREVLIIEANMNPMIAAIRSRNAEKNLQRLIESSLADFIKAGSCTFYRLAYMKGLQESLTGLCRVAEKDEINEQLKEHLFFNNLNTAAHVAYYKKEIQKQLSETFDLQEQQDLLYAYQKQFKSWEQQQSQGFSPKNKGIKAILLAYAKAEIKYLNSKLKSVLIPKANPSVPAASQTTINYRIPVTFSVDALAYFFRLLVKAGVVNGGPKTALLLFVSRSFQTPGIGNASLSVKSLENKYRQVVQQTANSVRVVLKRMLKILDEEYG